MWQIDESDGAGTPDGWGISASLSAGVDDGWMPFLRGGWAHDGGSFYEASLSTGFGYAPRPGQALLGFGLNWNRPNKSTYGEGLNEQYSIEFFQQLQLTEGIEFTPSIQVIKDPALDPAVDWSVLFGLRLRAAL